MRKKNQEIRDEQILEEMLSHAIICRVAMTDREAPYLLAFNYGYRNRVIYIHSATVGKKIDLLRENPRVCFEIESKSELVKGKTACDWSTTYRSIVGYGNVEIVTDAAQKKEGLEIIMSQHGAPELNVFKEKNVDSVVILKLTIDSMTGKQSGNWDRVHKQSLITLETDRLVMEEICREDVEDIHQLHCVPAVDEFNTLGIPGSEEETRKIMEPEISSQTDSPRSRYTWKVIIKESPQFIGLAGFTLSNDKFRLGEIYYKLHPDYWGQGYATEVARRLVKAGFDEFNLHKVEAGVAVKNERSIRVLEKAGMQQEGLRRNVLPIRGEWVDNYHFAIVEGDQTY